MTFMLSPLQETTAIAVAAALGGTVVGFLLNEWSARVREKRQAETRIGQTAVLVLFDLTRALRIVNTVPDEPIQITEPSKQLPRTIGTSLAIEGLIRALLDFPHDSQQRVAIAYAALDEFRTALRRVRERVDQMLTIPWLDEIPAPTWDAKSTADGEFLLRYAELLFTRNLYRDVTRGLLPELGNLSAAIGVKPHADPEPAPQLGLTAPPPNDP